MADIHTLSTRELVAAIRDRKLSPLEAVDAALARIDACASLNAFVTVCGDRAREQARQAEAVLMRGDALPPLFGVPFSVKDLTPTEGVRTTMGSRLFEDQVPTADALAVARVRAAGAILIGKTTSPEFGHKPFTEAPLFGRTLNPYDATRTCGGSSGGAAVAAAAGMGQFALGTDGGGSIRIPAACCGIVGIKPTLGAVPNPQVPDLFAANSYIGPMARDVGDTRLVLEALLGTDRRDPYGQLPLGPARRSDSLKGLRIGWLKRCGNVLDPAVEALCQAAVDQAEALGATIVPVELDFVSLEPAFLVILESLLAARFGDRLAKDGDRLDPTLVKTIEKGLRHSGVDVQRAAFARTACFQKIEAVLNTVDLIASPTLSAPPLPVGLDPHGQFEIAGQPAGTIRGAWYPYTYPMNLTGHPALSMPCGMTGGLPVGLQLVGRWHEDLYLLDVAEQLETALGLPAAVVG
jgi:aspartyl-tRNA(Asn)/glutamyl-tRNA(Gln) amidotransferase subunit A